MKYWLYEKRRITGPLEAQLLARRPGFGPGSLVCPAELSGQEPTDWIPAKGIPELALGPSGPPAAPQAPRLDTEMVGFELEGVRRAVAALEMRLRAVEDVSTKHDARSSADSGALQQRLTQLSDAIASQDVRTEATDAALAACRASIDELHGALGKAEERIREVSRESSAQLEGVSSAREAGEQLSAALRDGLAGLHRLLRAAETRLETLDGRAQALGAAQAAQKAHLEEAVREVLTETAPNKEIAALESKVQSAEVSLSELATKLSETRTNEDALQSRVRAIERRPDTPLDHGRRVDELATALARLPAEPASAEQLKPLTDRLESLAVELAAAQARKPEAGPEVLAAAKRAEEAVSALLALQGRLLELERRAAAADKLSVRVEELSAELRDAKAAKPAGSAAPEPDPFALPSDADARVSAIERSVSSLTDRLAQAEARPSSPDGAGPLKRWLPYGVGAGGALAGALGVSLWAGRASAPPPPAPVAIPAPAPVFSPPPPLPTMETPPLESAPATLKGSPEPAAPGAADPALPPEPKHGEVILPPPSLPKPKRRKPAAPKATLPGMETPEAPAGRVIPGVVRLLKAQAKDNVVTLKLSEGAKPKVSYSPAPPRLLLEFSDAKSKLPPKDLGGARPHIAQVRARESDVDSRLLWVEIQLDKTGTNRIEHKGSTLLIRFDFAE